MSFTVLEYGMERNGVPVEPATVETLAHAFGAAFTVTPGARMVVVIPDADMVLRISAAGSAAVAGYYQIAAGDARSFAVGRGGVQLYGIAA